MRGHRIYAPNSGTAWGTIPAGAGTPSTASWNAPSGRDYPRGCGDTSTTTRSTPGRRGLSPRVRGHRHLLLSVLLVVGTIPAGAGTPARPPASGERARDYPRGCGDTPPARAPEGRLEGLSPRVRGHRAHDPSGLYRLRTIPAGAGTPSGPRSGDTGFRDYPRGCGDTLDVAPTARAWAGLSPRVRGHLRRLRRAARRNGTIPAGAGTPLQHAPTASLYRDYPRGCGDTARAIATGWPGRGLSPRVRGHRESTTRRPIAGRTIPAGAGTPALCHAVRSHDEDYPRGCGDTTLRGCSIATYAGLSPRVRGHPGQKLAFFAEVRTIPAGAGTPKTR